MYTLDSSVLSALKTHEVNVCVLFGILIVGYDVVYICVQAPINNIEDRFASFCLIRMIKEIFDQLWESSLGLSSGSVF